MTSGIDVRSLLYLVFFFSTRRRHTRCLSDWSSDVCSSDLVDRDEKAVTETARLVEAEGAKATVVLGDVTDEDACNSVVDGATAALGGLDGLVLNVGIGAGGRLAGTSAAQWDLVFAVNVRSHFLLTKAALPHRIGPHPPRTS